MKLLLGLFLTLNVYAYDCSIHKIYCKIIKLNPNLDKRYAKRLSDLLYVHSKTPMISVAIGMQESSLRFISRYGKVYEGNRVVRGITDFGPFQIHLNTARRYELDLDKLSKDLEYNVMWHSKILADKMNKCKRLGKKAFACYHSFTPLFRDIYYKKVMRFM